MVGDTLWLVPVEGVRAVDHRLWEGLLEIADLLIVSHFGVCGDITARAPEHLTLSFIGVPTVVKISEVLLIEVSVRAHRLLNRVIHAIYPVRLIFDATRCDHSVVLLLLVDWADVGTGHGLLLLFDLGLGMK